jgi:hypothetical protein
VQSFEQKLGLIGLQFRSSLNQALAFGLVVDKSGGRDADIPKASERVHESDVG